MTESEILTIAVQASESAKSAHHRLDRINGSFDRLTGEIARANATSEEILRRLAHEDGADEASKSFLDSKRFLITCVLMVLGGSVASVIFNLIIRSHG